MTIENLEIKQSIDEINTEIQEIWKKIYPVGSIYFSVKNTNPGTLFGGTWVSWGSGKVPVGVNTGDSSFNTVEKTGGSKSISHTHTTAGHVLTISEIPSHRHNIYRTGSTGSPGYGTAYTSSNSGDDGFGTEFTGGGKSHSHGNTGSSSVTVLQPYITCYMWKRTA